MIDHGTYREIHMDEFPARLTGWSEKILNGVVIFGKTIIVASALIFSVRTFVKLNHMSRGSL